MTNHQQTSQTEMETLRLDTLPFRSPFVSFSTKITLLFISLSRNNTSVEFLAHLREMYRHLISLLLQKPAAGTRHEALFYQYMDL